MGAFPIVGKGLPGLPVRPPRVRGEHIHNFGYLSDIGADVLWTVPPGVHSISALFVTKGTAGAAGGMGSYYSGGAGGAGGTGGSSYYLNDIAVKPGQVIAFRALGYFNGLDVASTFTKIAVAGTGSYGGWGSLSGAGAQGLGGQGLNLIDGTTAVVAGYGGGYLTGSHYGGAYGGGGGGGGGGMEGGAFYGAVPGLGHQGGLRIVWPGSIRKFPSTDTGAD